MQPFVQASLQPPALEKEKQRIASAGGQLDISSGAVHAVNISERCAWHFWPTKPKYTISRKVIETPAGLPELHQGGTGSCSSLPSPSGQSTPEASSAPGKASMQSIAGVVAWR